MKAIWEVSKLDYVVHGEGLFLWSPLSRYGPIFVRTLFIIGDLSG